MLTGLRAVVADPSLISMERMGDLSFRLWGSVLRMVGSPGTRWRAALVMVFAIYLTLVIVALMPIRCWQGACCLRSSRGGWRQTGPTSSGHQVRRTTILVKSDRRPSTNRRLQPRNSSGRSPPPPPARLLSSVATGWLVPFISVAASLCGGPCSTVCASRSAPGQSIRDKHQDKRQDKR